VALDQSEAASGVGVLRSCFQGREGIELASVDQPARLFNRDDVEDATDVGYPAASDPPHDREEPPSARAQLDDLRLRLRDAEARRRSLEKKLKQSLTHLVTAEGVRAERDRLREEVVVLRRQLARLRSTEAERDTLRARLEEGISGGEEDEGEPAEKLSEALGFLVRAESIRTEREELRARLRALEEENAHLREEVARLGHPSAQRRRWPRSARYP
jgi:polyhydroxyalkanoate synthesis regulator phasin